MKVSAKSRVAREQVESYLREKGWWLSDDGWRHGALKFPWPLGGAGRLQAEADEGGQDPIHRSLRGED